MARALMTLLLVLALAHAQACLGTIEHCTKCETADDTLCNLCEDGYFSITTKTECRKCGPTCKTCELFSMNNDYNCTSCIDDVQFIKIDEYRDCQCRKGTFLSNFATVCKPCNQPAPCGFCMPVDPNNEEITQCTGCYSEYMTMDHITRECKCYDYYYPTADNTECTRCPKQCYGCKRDELNPTRSVCIACRDPHDMIPGTCECKEGYTINNDLDDCIECPKYCSKCIGRYNTIACTDCKDPRMDIFNKCACPLHTSYSQDFSRCLDCSKDGSCLECNDLTGMLTCTKCYDESMELEDGQCKCPLKFYFKNGCRLCDPRCEECTGNSNNQCKVCDANNNAIMENGACVCRSGYTLEGRSCKFNSPMVWFYVIAVILSVVLIAFIILGVLACCVS